MRPTAALSLRIATAAQGCPAGRLLSVRRRHERPDWRTGDLLTELQSGFGLTIHRRSLERVLRGKKKALQP
jgi:transposase